MGVLATASTTSVDYCALVTINFLSNTLTRLGSDRVTFLACESFFEIFKLLSKAKLIENLARDGSITVQNGSLARLEA